MTPEVAIRVLTSQGYTVTPANVPGLFDVVGQGELTTNQLIDFARRFGGDKDQPRGLAFTRNTGPAPQVVDGSEKERDGRIKIEIDGLVQALNSALAEADRAGIGVEIEVLPIYRVGKERATMRIGARLFRQL